MAAHGVLANGEPPPDYLFNITAWVAGSGLPRPELVGQLLMVDGKLTQPSKP
ncbi:MAG: hypothetical protein IPO15_21210, partial [Anaerolineae bacterium]|nr:hypothetical protein [Anaerolineae bacterium]